MSPNDSFNPIIAAIDIPASDGLPRLGRKPARDLDLHQSQASRIVLRSPSPGGAAKPTLGPHGADLRKAVAGASHLYRIDLTPKALVWKHACTECTDADDSFRVVLMTTVSVADPVTIVERNVIDARMHLRSSLIDRIEAICREFAIDATDAAAEALQQALTKQTFDCGLRIDWAHASVEPGPQSSKRQRAEEEQRLQHRLEHERMEYEAKQRLAQLERDNRIERERARLETAREDEQHARERKRRDDEEQRSKHKAAEAKAALDAELATAEALNKKIAAHPAGMMGYLIALENSAPVQDAITFLKERQEAVWGRYSELRKQKSLTEPELRALALAIMRDPAGGAFGLPDGLPDLASDTGAVDDIERETLPAE